MELRVLVVDDDPDAANSLTMLLADCGCDTRTVYSGRAALASAMSDPPELAVVDINMPAMDGYEVARQLRSLATGAAMRLAAVTGAPDIETADKAADAGFDMHFAKPLTGPNVDQLLGSARGKVS